MMASDSSDDKLGMFRQQAAIVAKKKEAAAEKLQEMQQQLQQIRDDLAVLPRLCYIHRLQWAALRFSVLRRFPTVLI